MPATKTDNMLSSLRLGVIERLALSFWAGTLPEDVDRIPLLMRPRGSEIMSRCCIYKDRAILRERLRAAMGFRLEDETDDSIPLRTYAEEALERKEPNWPILTVCDIACQGCMRARYYVTDACQGCVARSCIGSCRFGAISFSRGRSTIDPEKCRNCGMCMDACPFGAVMERSEVLPVLRALASGRHVTALMAPAIVGQFPGGPARIVTALRRLGFSDVMEVALGADVTSQREAAEFVERMERGDTFMTTSCCPAYVEAVRRHAPELLPHVSETATPMHYTAEIARERHPDTVTVFIGPCVAKRQEGLHDEMVDYVLTFEEVGALFNARGIVVEECEEHELEHPSNEARGYAIAGGVSAAVEKLVGDRFEVRPVAINGLSPQGLKKLQSFVKGGCPGNLVEVMTCVGGCVGGAGVVMPAAKGAKAVENFATKGKV